MRVARLLSLVFEVDSHPGIDASELAELLGVSVRTVYRDVSALQEAGIPLYGEVGRGGGFRLVDGYRSRAASLRSGEAAALLAGAMPAVAEQLGFAVDAERARRKVRSQITTASTKRSAPDSQILIDPIGWYRVAPPDVPHLRVLSEALSASRVIEVVYRPWHDPPEVTRRLEPHGLVLKAGTWYAMARSQGLMRTYRVDQIVAANVTDEHFATDPAFDLAAAWAAFVASFHERLRVIPVDVLSTRSARDRIRGDGDATLLSALNEALAGEPDDDTERVVTFFFESEDRAVSRLLGFGDEIEILSPQSVRGRLAETVAALTRRYSPALNRRG